MSELLPCPFCGRAPVFCADDTYGACTISCGCEAEPNIHKNKDYPEQAIAAWNRRIASTPSPHWRSLGWTVLGDKYGISCFEEKSDAEYRAQAAILNGATNVSIAEVFVRLATAPHKGEDDG